ncbi:hypothetical protein Scep_026630 [Stephania cephalantha]|uniref:Uncharacterized protein n=1 Tax=Stephania cephalantha TaxID=152367 RepID=A0AAP0HSR2_9MAGN
MAAKRRQQQGRIVAGVDGVREPVKGERVLGAGDRISGAGVEGGGEWKSIYDRDWEIRERCFTFGFDFGFKQRKCGL